MGKLVKRFIVEMHVSTCYSAIIEAENEEAVEELLVTVDPDDMDLSYSSCDYESIREVTEYDSERMAFLRITEDGYEVIK